MADQRSLTIESDLSVASSAVVPSTSIFAKATADKMTDRVACPPPHVVGYREKTA